MHLGLQEVVRIVGILLAVITAALGIALALGKAPRSILPGFYVGLILVVLSELMLAHLKGSQLSSVGLGVVLVLVLGFVCWLVGRRLSRRLKAFPGGGRGAGLAHGAGRAGRSAPTCARGGPFRGPAPRAGPPLEGGPGALTSN